MAVVTLDEDLFAIDLVVDAGDELVTNGFDVTVLGNCRIDGTFTTAAGTGGQITTVVLYDDFIVNGVLNAGDAHWILRGDSEQWVNFKNSSINDLKMNKTGGHLIMLGGVAALEGFFAPGLRAFFEAGQFFQFNQITMLGSPTERIRLRSTSNGNAWFFKVGGTPVVSYVEVRDSDASPGVEIDADDGTNIDLGGNTNWKFGVHVVREPSIIEIMERRLDIVGAGNSMVGGNPHRFMELYGGEAVEIWSYAPDPTTFRGIFYYNAVENRLYKKFGIPPTWKMIGGIAAPEIGAISLSSNA